MDKILIFGASGFIGLNLVKKLSSFNNFIITGTYLNNKPKVELPNVTFLKINLTKYLEMKNKIQEADFIIHLAADRDPFLEGKSGINQINKNQLITENISKLAKKIKCKKMIYISSAYIYSGTRDKRFKENSFLDPKESLGKSKLLCEKILKNYSSKNYFKCISFRLFTVYGNGASDKQFVEIAIKKIKSKLNSINFGNGSIKRDMIYIDDVTNGIYLSILNFKKINKIYLPINLGYGRSLKIESIVNMICKGLKIKKKISYNENNSRIGDNDHLCNISLLENIFKWKPETTFRSGLLKMMNERLKIGNKI